MVAENKLPLNSQSAALLKPALYGALVAFILVGGFLTFLLLVGNDMELGAWILPPLAIATASGAIGGMSYGLMRRYFHFEGWKMAITHTVFVLFFLAGLWLSMVLGLAMVGLWD